MIKIKKKMDTEEDRLFWESFPSNYNGEEIILPNIGDDWWNAETELSSEWLKICRNV